ncbi:GH25 family lysozyme [Helcococcus ovis]|uniref:GH25 family lysozyme n=1 Tax=Helcococcus ovis TaxID=72026 RepID=UPI0038BAD0FF
MCLINRVKNIIFLLLIFTVSSLMLLVTDNIVSASTDNFVKDDAGNIKYILEGQIQYNWKYIDGSWYYFDSDTGNMKYGWQKISDKWYYLDEESGQMHTSWSKINDDWYFLDRENGDMKTGWEKINNKWYFLDRKNGDMKTGWEKINNKWYFLDRENGDMKTGWEKVDGKWYFLDRKDGDMKTGWKEIDDKWYFLDRENGDMKTGWLNLGSKQYYLDPINGDMKSGTFLVEGVKYSTTSNGNIIFEDIKEIGNQKLSINEMIAIFKNNKTKIEAVDISEWNGDSIYWDELKSKGIKAVIVRGGYSTDEDRNARRNIREALQKGFNVGAYWAMYPLNKEEARKEAEAFNNLMKEFKGRIELPLFADFEYFSDNYANGKGVTFTRETRTDVVVEFLETLKNYGWYVGNYTNVDYAENYFDYTRLEKYDIWLADWRTEPSRKWLEKSGMHQYSSSGEAVGNGSKTTDMNHIFYDYPSIIKNLGFNGFIATYKLPKLPEKIEKPIDDVKRKIVKKSIDTIAREVLDGKWGYGDDRKNRLEEAGYNYYDVQKRVNEILGY